MYCVFVVFYRQRIVIEPVFNFIPQGGAMKRFFNRLAYRTSYLVWLYH